jgi:hypothetical protein
MGFGLSLQLTGNLVYYSFKHSSARLHPAVAPSDGLYLKEEEDRR